MTFDIHTLSDRGSRHAASLMNGQAKPDKKRDPDNTSIGCEKSRTNPNWGTFFTTFSSDAPKRPQNKTNHFLI